MAFDTSTHINTQKTLSYSWKSVCFSSFFWLSELATDIDKSVVFCCCRCCRYYNHCSCWQTSGFFLSFFATFRKKRSYNHLTRCKTKFVLIIVHCSLYDQLNANVLLISNVIIIIFIILTLITVTTIIIINYTHTRTVLHKLIHWSPSSLHADVALVFQNKKVCFFSVTCREKSFLFFAFLAY